MSFEEYLKENLQHEAQERGSAGTSQKQVASLHNTLMKKGIYQPNQVVLDWGGGKYDLAKDKVEGEINGINFFVYDKYNRNTEYNNNSLASVKKAGGADIITIANVLNVIKEKDERVKMLKDAKKYLKKGGSVYIIVYNATRTPKYQETDDWVGQPTKEDSWQNAQPLSFYVPEVEEAFQNVTTRGSVIVAN